jgi:transposase
LAGLAQSDDQLQRKPADLLLVEGCDMRKGYNGLCGLVSSSFGQDPRSGALYVFCNRRRSRIKVLY